MNKHRPIQKVLHFLMRVTLVQMLLMATVTTLVMASPTNGQEILEKRVTVNAENMELKAVLDLISKQTDARFTYRAKVVQPARRVSLNVTNATLAAVLESLFSPSIGYKVVGSEIVLMASSVEESSAIAPNYSPVAIQVSGTAKDDTGSPLPGVNILEKGTTNGTTTDAEGKYVIAVQNESSVLIFSFIGFVTEEVAVGARTQIDVALTPDVQSLQEVVVTGYGTSQARRDVTGAVASVNADQIKSLAITSFDQAIQGRVAGVQVAQNSGEPGGGVSIRIRGAGSINNGNEPLYIVDGTPYTTLNAINPNDIEKMDILKDASTAAIYGSRAINGVVLVTTRRGKSGKLTVNFDAYNGVENVYKKMDLLDGPQFAKLANEHLTNGGTVAANPVWNNPNNLANSDWQNAVFRTGAIQNYTLSLSGGSDKVTTLFSAGYFKQKGIIIASDYERYNFRLNQDYNISQKLKAGITLNGSFINQNKVDWSTPFNGVLTVANSMQPTNPITTDIDGSFGYNLDGTIDPNGNTFYGWEGYANLQYQVNNTPARDYYDVNLGNPVHYYNKYQKDKPYNQNILASAHLDYEIIKGLTAKSIINLTFDNASRFQSKRVAPSQIDLVGQYRKVNNVGEYVESRQSWNWVNSLTYSKVINKHNIGVTAAMDVLEANIGKYINSGGFNAPDNAQSISASTDRSVSGNSFIPNSLISYIGRATYEYADKYLFSATVRRDGSSKFAEGNKWGTFPSVSAGWRISEESFFKPITFIDDFKVRASYGIVGNQGIDDLLYLSTYFVPGFDLYTLGDNQTGVQVSQPGKVGDKDLKWEESSQTNLGIDASFLGGKFTLTAEYFTKKIYDMLGNFPVARYLGINGNSVTRNGFSMENKGLELTLGYQQRFNQVNFSASANFSTLHNEVTKLTGGEKDYVDQPLDAGASTRTYVGQTVAGFYGYITDGIIQNNDELRASPMRSVDALLRPGDRKYKDLNGDNVINGDDRAILGHGLPGYTFGLTLKADYKGFDLSVLLNGQGDVQAANLNKYYLYDMRYFNGNGLTNVSADMLNSWKVDNTNTDLPRNSDRAPVSNRWFSNFHIEDASFVRIRNVQVGYTLPSSVAQKAGMSRARIFISTNNLYTFTKYTGYDPEIGAYDRDRGSSVLKTGVDAGRYPIARNFTIGVNCTF